MQNHRGNRLHNTKNAKPSTPALSTLAIALRASVFALGLASGTSQAAQVGVTSNQDDNGLGCTLREALVSVNERVLQPDCSSISNDPLGTNDSIIFIGESLVTDTITLTAGELVVSQDVVIFGAAASESITINANKQSRVFNVDEAILNISNLTIANGSTNTVGGGIYAYQSTISINNSTISGHTAASGGGAIGVFSGTSVSLTNSVISENFASYGGGIAANSSSISISNTTVRGNTVSYFTNGNGGYGGGINANNNTSVSLSNSTVSGNSAQADGGGIFAASTSRVSLSSATVSGNSARYGGGIFSDAGSSMSLNNTTVSANAATVTGGGIAVTLDNDSVLLSNSIIANSIGGDCAGLNTSFTSDMSTIVEDGSCGETRTGDPGLLPLANNGGPTQTHALRVNSIARDSGILSSAINPLQNCTTSDQRGELRNDGDGTCDVGAVDFFDDDGFFVIPLGNGRVVVVPL